MGYPSPRRLRRLDVGAWFAPNLFFVPARLATLVEQKHRNSVVFQCFDLESSLHLHNCN